MKTPRSDLSTEFRAAWYRMELGNSALDLMSGLTYKGGVTTGTKPLRWLHGQVKTPPMSLAARRESGFLLRALQDGVQLPMPQSRPMPDIGPRCHELRVNDENRSWRVMCRLDPDAVVVLDVMEKRTARTPKSVITECRRRLRSYERSAVP